MKDKSQLQAGRESVERGNAVGAKTERERAYLAAVGKLYSDYASTGRAVSPAFLRDTPCKPGDPPPLVPVLDGKPPLIGACLVGLHAQPVFRGEKSVSEDRKIAELNDRFRLRFNIPFDNFIELRARNL
jgi:hypothetical protein